MALSDITSSTTKYTVSSGDTFSEIAERCYRVGMSGYSSGYNNYVNQLKSLNLDVENINLIYKGQTLILQGSAAKKTTSKSKQAKITAFGWQSGQDANGTTVFATWAWDVKNTDHYEVRWKYATGDGVGFKGDYSDVEERQSIYSAPNNATHVSFQVRPISKTYKKNDKEYHYWSADWSTVKKYYFKNNPPGETGTPTLTLDGYKLTARLDGLTDLNATKVQFRFIKEVYDGDALKSSTTFKTGTATIKNGTVTYTCNIDPFASYKVMARGVRGDVYGEWSGYSEIIKGPECNDGYISAYATSANSIKVQWHPGKNDQTSTSGAIYDIQYTTVKHYFNTNPNGVTTVTFGDEDNKILGHEFDIVGLETGHEYFLRARSYVTKESQKTAKWYSGEGAISLLTTGSLTITTTTTTITDVDYISVVLGSIPTAPTTWSDPATTVNATEEGQLTLHWTHNSADNSRQTEAHLQIEQPNAEGNMRTTDVYLYSAKCETQLETNVKVIEDIPKSFKLENGIQLRVLMTHPNYSNYVKLQIRNVEYDVEYAENYSACTWDANVMVLFEYNGTKWIMKNNNIDQMSNSYVLYTDTASLTSGTTIKWRVQTAGVLEDESGNYVYSPWSIQRTVSVYGQPELALAVTDKNGNDFDELDSLPINILASLPDVSGNAVHYPIGYHIAVVANESDEDAVDNSGNPKPIKAGDVVYSNYIDTTSSPFTYELSAKDITLTNGMSYTLICTVAMNSGLSAQQSVEFTVVWEVSEYWPTASISYNQDDYTASITPYCYDDNDNLVDVILSVYRREPDGSFTEIETDINNLESEGGVTVVDPHPALDYARYRIVAKDNATGAITYYDMPGYPTDESAVIIQWDEQWSTFDISDDIEDALAEPVWSGSLLRLPYNISVSDSYDPDVELINYIGREHPVSYYGTHIGQSSSWSVDIPKTDIETLYAIRRLARYKGDVYVREPSGTGYWANIKISYSHKYDDLIIPINMSITRVEGGA